jgi:N4-gp56 family major capsid protein
MRWNGTGAAWVLGDDTANIDADDAISYKSLVLAKAYAKNQYIRGIRTGAGEEVFHVFVTPDGMARLKLDADYLNNVRYAAPRSNSNPLFAGTTSVMIDGLVIHEFRHVYNTSGLASGSRWGSGGTLHGMRALFCGAQALGIADIGNAYWEEEKFDYKNQQGISVGKMFGMVKPKYHSIYSGSVQDFGVIALDYHSP